MRRNAPQFALLTLLALGLAAALPAAAQRALPDSREQITLSYAPLVKQAGPAVVNIYSKRIVKQQVPRLMQDPFFRQFFGDAFGGLPRERVEQSLGSGVILAADGLIITNAHVIKDADEITVVLADRREFPARLISSDERVDLAVLRVETRGERLPFLQLHDSDDVQVGDLVLAIGNPFGVGQTVTSGIVSAVARTAVGINDYNFFIQTDAAINPGNSGGALIAMDGKLIGINTAIFSQSGGSVGIGFAIPANMVRTVVDAVAAGGKLVRPWMGAGGQPVTGDIANSLGLSRPAGVLINQIRPGGPADRAGVKVGDVVTAVNGRAVDDPESLRYRVATLPVGGTATLSVLRQGRDQQVSLKLIAPPEDPPRQQTVLQGRTPLSGAEVANLNPALVEEIRFTAASDGVVITGIDPRSPAAQVGFRPGDLLLRINEREVRSVSDVVKILETPARRWQVVFRRGDQTLTANFGG